MLLGLGPRELVAQRRPLILELRPVASRVEGLAEPVDEVARGLERPVRPGLDRAEDGRDHGLAPVEGPPAIALAVIEAEECQRGGDEQQQHRPSTAHLLAVHVFLALTAQSRFSSRSIAWPPPKINRVAPRLSPAGHPRAIRE